MLVIILSYLLLDNYKLVKTNDRVLKCTATDSTRVTVLTTKYKRYNCDTIETILSDTKGPMDSTEQNTFLWRQLLVFITTYLQQLYSYTIYMPKQMKNQSNY